MKKPARKSKANQTRQPSGPAGEAEKPILDAKALFKQMEECDPPPEVQWGPPVGAEYR